MRLRGGMLATPVRWYRHPGTGRSLVLVLNNHVGTRGYFETMRLRIAELEDRGAAVYAEGISAAPDTVWETATADERAARDVLRTFYHDRPIVMAAGLGWVFQDALRPGAGWANPDMTDLGLIRLGGTEPILEMGRIAAESTAKLGADCETRYMQAVAPVIYRRLARPHAWLTRVVTNLAPDLYSVLLEYRSKLAVRYIDPQRDAVMIYGAEHADTLDTALAEAGWMFTGRVRWLNVGQLPPLHTTIADVVAMAFEVGKHLNEQSQAARDRPASAAAA
jgi:hypothetical protein